MYWSIMDWNKKEKQPDKLVPQIVWEALVRNQITVAEGAVIYNILQTWFMTWTTVAHGALSFPNL